MSIGKNLNYIKRAFKHPCATPNPVILVETAFAAGVPALMNLVLFGCGDIVKMKAGVAPWHTRALKGFIKSAADPRVLGPTKFLYASGYGALEAALWWWLVADTVTGFVADWMSLVYQEQGCDLPGNGYFQAGLTSNFEDAGNGKLININGISSVPCLSASLHSIRIPFGCSATISWDTEFKPFLNDPNNQGTVRTYLRRSSDGVQIGAQPGYPQKDGSQVTGGGAHVSALHIGQDEEYTLAWDLDRGLMGCTGGTLRISSYGRKLDLIPAGCKPKLPPQPYPVRPVPPPLPKESQENWISRINKSLTPPLY
jgi:hypothetical protein